MKDDMSRYTPRDEDPSGNHNDNNAVGNNASPEPPASYKPDLHDSLEQQDLSKPQQQQTRPNTYAVGPTGRMTITLSRDEAQLFESSRRLVSIAQICAIVALFVGGVLLSAVALGLAITSYRRLSTIVIAHSNNPAAAALRQPAMAAIAMSVVSLVANAVSLIFVYPLVMQAFQSGDLSTLFGGLGSSAPTSSSTWG